MPTNPGVDALLFLFIAIAIGAFTTHFLTATGRNVVPYTVVLFLIGIAIAEFDKHCDLKAFGLSVQVWTSIDGELVLYTFLPALVMGDSMKLNWYECKQAFISSLLLAGSGVIIGAYIMGALTFAMPFGWSWNLCMLFGSIMSTTDTVAVVALLNEAGASSWLTMLITGESLLNDSTGIVMFTLFFNMNLGKTYNASSIISFLCVTIIGSALLGIAFGFIAIRWLRIVNRPLIAEDMTVQIAITLVCAYLSFLTAQYYCDISGVLACSFAGGMLAWLGPPLILNHETMHNVWDMLEWLGNTLIFILAGLIFGSRTLDNVAPIDWLYLIVLYIFLNLTRVVVVFSHFPLLTRLGNGCTMPEALFMCWSGLRGALGIVLASIVETSFQELGISSVQGNRLFFYVGGLSALTLVVNATTAKIVLRRLRLVNTATADKDIIINQTRRRIRKKLDHLLISIRNLNQFSVAELDEIKECCSAFQKKDGRESLVATDRATSIGRGSLFVGLQQLMETAEQQEVTMESLSKPALLAYVRTVYLEIVRVHYWHMIEEGKLPRHSATATMLLYSIEVGLDHVKESTLSDFKVIEDEVINSQRRLLMLLDYLIKYLGPLSMYFSFLREMLVALREKRSVRALLAFIEAHEHAQEKIQEIFHVEANGHHTNEVKRPEEQIVIKESKKSVTAAKSLLQSFDDGFIRNIQKNQCTRAVLAHQLELVNTLVKEGMLSVKDGDGFIGEINEDIHRVEKMRKKAVRDNVGVSESNHSISGVSIDSLSIGRETMNAIVEGDMAMTL